MSKCQNVKKVFLCAIIVLFLIPVQAHADHDANKCDEASEIGRQTFHAANNEFYVCRDHTVGWEALNDIGPAAGGSGFIDGQINHSDCELKQTSGAYTLTVQCSADYTAIQRSDPFQTTEITISGPTLIVSSGVWVGTTTSCSGNCYNNPRTDSLVCCRYKNH